MVDYSTSLSAGVPFLFSARAQLERILSADHRGSLGGLFSRWGLVHIISLRWIVSPWKLRIVDEVGPPLSVMLHVDVGEYWT